MGILEWSRHEFVCFYNDIFRELRALYVKISFSFSMAKQYERCLNWWNWIFTTSLKEISKRLVQTIRRLWATNIISKSKESHKFIDLLVVLPHIDIIKWLIWDIAIENELYLFKYPTPPTFTYLNLSLHLNIISYVYLTLLNINASVFCLKKKKKKLLKSRGVT